VTDNPQNLKVGDFVVRQKKWPMEQIDLVGLVVEVQKKRGQQSIARVKWADGLILGYLLTENPTVIRASVVDSIVAQERLKPEEE
jgi:uncharacterized alpha/beta hydrolase family protein